MDDDPRSALKRRWVCLYKAAFGGKTAKDTRIGTVMDSQRSSWQVRPGRYLTEHSRS